MKNKNGFTLVEVIAASMVFLIAVGILSAGGGFVVKVRRRTVELERGIAEIGESLIRKEDCVEGIVTLNLEDMGEISGDGWLFCGKQEALTDMPVEIIYVEPVKRKLPQADYEEPYDAATSSDADITIENTDITIENTDITIGSDADLATASNGKEEMRDES